MKKLLLVVAVFLSGCSSLQELKQYFPRDHDPVMFNYLVVTDVSINHINCDKPDWSEAHRNAEILARYTEWRKDSQATNIKGLFAHTERMSKGSSKTFCELGKNTALQRIEAAKSAWQGR